MKIKITFNQKEKQALKELITKFDMDDNVLDKKEEETLGPVKYNYDGEGTLKIKITTKLTIMLIKFTKKISKHLIKFVGNMEEYWTGYENAKSIQSMEENNDVEES